MSAKSPEGAPAVSIAAPESAAAWMGMDLITVDNGLDFSSYGFREACSSLGIEVVVMTPRAPSCKGAIERFFRTLKTRLVPWEPKTTHGGKA